jgi:hypothetical protein
MFKTFVGGLDPTFGSPGAISVSRAKKVAGRKLGEGIARPIKNVQNPPAKRRRPHGRGSKTSAPVRSAGVVCTACGKGEAATGRPVRSEVAAGKPGGRAEVRVAMHPRRPQQERELDTPSRDSFPKQKDAPTHPTGAATVASRATSASEKASKIWDRTCGKKEA